MSYKAMKNIAGCTSLLLGLLITLSIYLLNTAEYKELIKIIAPFTFIGASIGCFMARAFIIEGPRFDADGDPVPPESLGSVLFSGVWHGIYGIVIIGWVVCGTLAHVIDTKILKLGIY